MRVRTPLLSKPPFDFRPGTAPLLVSMPHVGTELPECMRGRLSDACVPLGDTDWHLPRLYDFVEAMGASLSPAHRRGARPHKGASRLCAALRRAFHPRRGAAALRGRVAVNGRFKGGYITRRYGRPKHDIHAVQLELVQRAYMNEAPPYEYLPGAAAQVRPWLERFVATMLEWGRSRYG
jgi:N-formylglutamate amidohydrolase